MNNTRHFETIVWELDQKPRLSFTIAFHDAGLPACA
jgi:hypothetical protein